MSPKPLDNLDIALSRNLPSLGKREVVELRTKLLDHMVKGLADGYDIALIKDDEISDEIKIKVLSFIEKK
jgi:hypothetical protein